MKYTLENIILKLKEMDLYKVKILGFILDLDWSCNGENNSIHVILESHEKKIVITENSSITEHTLSYQIENFKDFISKEKLVNNNNNNYYMPNENKSYAIKSYTGIEYKNLINQSLQDMKTLAELLEDTTVEDNDLMVQIGPICFISQKEGYANGLFFDYEKMTSISQEVFLENI